jgi:DNA-directed RNA polymerase subunit M/transcription elongation factor TFIIS
MEHALRDFARTRLATHFTSGATVRNAEKSIYNWSVQQTRGQGDVASWENRSFKWRYKHKVIHLLEELGRAPVVEAGLEVVDDRVNLELKLVPQLVHRVQRKELDVKGLAKYPPDLLWSDGPYSHSMLKLREKDMMMEKARSKDENYTGLFKCGKCKGVKTTYYQMQTRSADEPMVRTHITLIVKCVSTNALSYRQLSSPAQRVGTAGSADRHMLLTNRRRSG